MGKVSARRRLLPCIVPAVLISLATEIHAGPAFDLVAPASIRIDTATSTHHIGDGRLWIWIVATSEAVSADQIDAISYQTSIDDPAITLSFASAGHGKSLMPGEVCCDDTGVRGFNDAFYPLLDPGEKVRGVDDGGITEYEFGYPLGHSGTATLTGTITIGDHVAHYATDVEFGDFGLNCCTYLEYLSAQRIFSTPIPFSADLDIKPESDLNVINPVSPGLIPVAVLGSADLTARDIDVTTLALGPLAAPLAHSKGPHFSDDVDEPYDFNDDGFDDVLAHFRTEETGIAFGDTEACVAGELLDGMPFEGCDGITTVPACGIGFELALLLPPLMWLRSRRRRLME